MGRIDGFAWRLEEAAFVAYSHHSMTARDALDRTIRLVRDFVADDVSDMSKYGLEASKPAWLRIEIKRRVSNIVPEGEKAKGFFVKPTIFSEVTAGMRIAREEIFGPVACAMRFGDAEEAARIANGTIYGLAAAVWTRDLKLAHRMASEIRAGTVWINGYNVLDAASPFGGYKQSGWGREMGHEVLELYTQTKAVVLGL